MARKFTTRELAHMQKIYKQTMSIAATAKACGCALSTVKKYRDLQKWVTPEQIEACKQNGNDITLTPDIAIRLARGWRENIGDSVLCVIAGISEGQLRWWLQNNTPATIILTTKTPDGQESKRIETIGLHDLRTREKNSLEYDYLAKHARVVELGMDAGTMNLKEARIGIEWRLSKLDPKKYGDKSGVEVNLNQQTNIFNIDELDLPIETRKQILSKIREKKQLEDKTDGTQ